MNEKIEDVDLSEFKDDPAVRAYLEGDRFVSEDIDVLIGRKINKDVI